MRVNVFKVAQSRPDDCTGLDELVQSEALDPETLVAILGKTEGNGCVNDFTRGFAVQSLKEYLRSHLNKKQVNEIVYVMSGGTEGVLSPHQTLFTCEPDPPNINSGWGLVLGIQQTRNFLPEEIGTLTMVDVVAAAVRVAIAQAQLQPQDVCFVQIKCPLIALARTQGKNTQQFRTQDSYKSMAYSRGAAALGVAVALGEVERSTLREADICVNYDLYSQVASTSAGVELQNCEILVLGNAPTSTSDFVIGRSVMRHALDGAAVEEAIAHTGQGRDRIVNIFAKAEADPTGTILGRRHTMLDDSDINHTRMARAVVGAVVAATVQDPMVYVSGGAEHQGPAGGGPVVAIARRA